MDKQAARQTIETLLVIQERDIHLLRLHAELDIVPVRKKAIESQLSSAREAMTQSQDKVKHQQAAIKKAELEVETVKEHIGKLRIQQNQLKTNDEFKAMNYEIAHDQEKIATVEDQILVLMESVESAQAELAAAKANVQKEEAGILDQLSKWDDRFSALSQELQQLQTERDALAHHVDPTWLARYNRIMENKKDTALSCIENGVCGGCHMSIPPHLAHDARRLESMVTCNYCGRMLYVVL